MSDWNTRRFQAQTTNIQNEQQQSPVPLHIPSYPLEKHLSHRIWLNTNYQDNFSKNHENFFKFHLVCYNVLAQNLLEDHMFLYKNCFHQNLKWYRRRDRLLKELFRQNADILCLQEIQHYHYENVFQPIFKDNGYESIYLKRSGNKSDGCCIFYKMNRLKLIEYKAVSFYQENIPILNRDNCGLIALFQPIIHNVTSEDLFCVATTHLLFSPKRGDIKLAQIQYFLAEIDQLTRKNSNTNSYYPIIFCGDFNAQPQSPLIQFLLTGYIKYDIYRCIDISGQILNNHSSYQLPSNALLPSTFVTSDCRLSTSNDSMNIRKHIDYHSTAILTHNKQFYSVYDLENSSDVTTNVDDKANLIDYIFYTQQDNDFDRLNLLSRFNLYENNQMVDVHMPNHQFPSDHFMLAAKFALKLRK